MTTKEWLNRGYNIDKEIADLICEKQQAESDAGISAIPSEERVKTSKTNNKENKYIKICEYIEEIDRRKEELYEVKKEILQTIKLVYNPIFRRLLILRYLQFKKWNQIAEDMHYSEVWARTELHNRALKEVGKYIK